MCTLYWLMGIREIRRHLARKLVFTLSNLDGNVDGVLPSGFVVGHSRKYWSKRWLATVQNLDAVVISSPFFALCAYSVRYYISEEVGSATWLHSLGRLLVVSYCEDIHGEHFVMRTPWHSRQRRDCEPPEPGPTLIAMNPVYTVGESASSTLGDRAVRSVLQGVRGVVSGSEAACRFY